MTHYTSTFRDPLTFDDARLFYNHVVSKCDVRKNIVQLTASATNNNAVLHIQSIPSPTLASEFLPAPSPFHEPQGTYFRHTIIVGMRTSFLPYMGTVVSSSRILFTERIPEDIGKPYPSLDDIAGIPIDKVHVNILRKGGIISSFSAIKTQNSATHEYVVLPYGIEARIETVLPPILRQYPLGSQK